MTAVQTVINHGFAYSKDCAGCGGKWQIYINASKPDFQIKIKKAGGKAKIYRGGQLIAQTVPDHLENVLVNKGL